MGAYTVMPIDEMASIMHGAVKLAGAELGLESFGLQVLDFPAGFSQYPEHDHADDGQEEVYVVLRGTVDYTVGGDSVSLDPGTILRVAASTRRTLVPGPDGVRLLAIGSPPNPAYERPEGFRTKVRA